MGHIAVQDHIAVNTGGVSLDHKLTGFAGDNLRRLNQHAFHAANNPAPGGGVVFEPAAILVCGHVRTFRV